MAGSGFNQRDDTQGTASITLTRRTGTNQAETTTWKGCIVDKASLKKIINNKNSLKNSPKYFVYLSNIELEEDVSEAEIKCYRYTNKTEKKCPPLCSPYDEKVLIDFNHVFLPCKSETFDSSAFLKKHSKKVTKRTVDLHGKQCFGLQRYQKDGKSLNKFFSFKIEKSEYTTKFYVEDSDFERLERTGPLLFGDYKSVVGCYEKTENTIIISTFGYEEKLTVLRKASTLPPQEKTGPCADSTDKVTGEGSSDQRSSIVTSELQEMQKRPDHKVLQGQTQGGNTNITINAKDNAQVVVGNDAKWTNHYASLPSTLSEQGEKEN